MRRALAVFAAALALPCTNHAASALQDHVEVAPAKTSIYLGTVTMTMPAFTRGNGTFSSPYAATVFPYFFFSETGTISVQVSDQQLQALEHRLPIDFVGTGTRSDGVVRRVEGRANPSDANSGKLKVKVIVSKRIELVFNTTYRFR